MSAVAGCLVQPAGFAGLVVVLDLRVSEVSERPIEVFEADL